MGTRLFLLERRFVPNVGDASPYHKHRRLLGGIMSSAANTGVFVSTAGAATQIEAQRASVPWYLWVGAIAVTSASIGGAWDVAWHRSIGRDTFWTPAHMAIYACGVLAGIVGLWLTALCTFGKDQRMRDASVSVFGLRAPLGVFLAGWGGLAMLTS